MCSSRSRPDGMRGGSAPFPTRLTSARAAAQVRKSYIVLATAAIVLTVSGLRAADVWRWRAETLRTAEARASNLSQVVAQYLIETFAAADAALRQLALTNTRFGGPA